MDRGAPVRLVVDAADRVGAVLRAVLPGHARRRGVVLIVHGRGPATPWRPADATIIEVVDACIGLGVAARWDAIGRPPASLGALERVAAPHSDRRVLAVELGGTRCELPRAWVGRHALLLSPTVIEAEADAAGPLASGLAALAVAARARGDADPTATGAAVLAQVFAGFTWVLDARAVLLRSRRTALSRALGLDRVVVHSDTGLVAAEVGVRARAIDAWVHRRSPTPEPPLELAGALAADPWPQTQGQALGVDGSSWSPRPRARGREARRP